MIPDRLGVNGLVEHYVASCGDRPLWGSEERGRDSRLVDQQRPDQRVVDARGAEQLQAVYRQSPDVGRDVVGAKGTGLGAGIY